MNVKGKKSDGSRDLDKIDVLATTESCVAHMNLLNNMHLQSIFQDDSTNILAIVSSTVDISFLRIILESVLSLITINLFPSALCLGFPLMLFILVMEKEEKIKDFLDTNGLKVSSYWFTFYVFNMC